MKTNSIRKSLVFVLIVALTVGLVGITPRPAAAAQLANANASVTCSQATLTGTITFNRDNYADDIENLFSIVVDGNDVVIGSGASFRGNLDTSRAIAENIVYHSAPSANPVTYMLVSDYYFVNDDGSIRRLVPPQIVFQAQHRCEGLPEGSGTVQGGPAVKFFDPKDGRVDPRPGDRLVIWCNPDNVVVYGVNNEGKGFLLVQHYYPSLIKAGDPGITKNSSTGSISVMMDKNGYGYAAWNGGPFKATGQGIFSKSFRCNTSGVQAATQKTPEPGPKPQVVAPGTKWLDDLRQTVLNLSLAISSPGVTTGNNGIDLGLGGILSLADAVLLQLRYAITLNLCDQLQSSVTMASGVSTIALGFSFLSEKPSAIFTGIAAAGTLLSEAGKGLVSQCGKK